ncbi:MAG: hypothetical protein WA240_10650 [Nitrospirota bacterium]
MEEIEEKYRKIADRAYREFTDVADYIWKSPRLIEHETKLEVQKLKNYFPNSEEHAKLRWHFESNKLNSVFPYLIAVGNTFSIMSLFESYLLIVAIELKKDTGIRTTSVSGSGINRIFNYFRSGGIDLEAIEPFHQIMAAIKIRNCLSHASGMLSWSKEEAELKRIQRSGMYLSKDHRVLRKKNGRDFDEVRITNSGFGERIQVDNMYAFVLASYLRDYLIGVCQSAALLNGGEKCT